MPLTERNCAGCGRGFISSNTVAGGKINFVITVVECVDVPRKTCRGESTLLIGPYGLNVCRSAGRDIHPRGKSKGFAEIDESSVEKLGRAVELQTPADFSRSQDRRNARDGRVLARTIEKRETALFQMPDEQVIGRPDRAIG